MGSLSDLEYPLLLQKQRYLRTKVLDLTPTFLRDCYYSTRKKRYCWRRLGGICARILKDQADITKLQLLAAQYMGAAEQRAKLLSGLKEQGRRSSERILQIKDEIKRLETLDCNRHQLIDGFCNLSSDSVGCGCGDAVFVKRARQHRLFTSSIYPQSSRISLPYE